MDGQFFYKAVLMSAFAYILQICHVQNIQRKTISPNFKCQNYEQKIFDVIFCKIVYYLTHSQCQNLNARVTKQACTTKNENVLFGFLDGNNNHLVL